MLKIINNKGVINVFILIIGVLILAGAGFFVFKQITTPPKTDNSLGEEKIVEQIDVGGNFKTYKNAQYGFSFKFPMLLTAVEGKIKPNTPYVVLKDAANLKINIIYIYEGNPSLSKSELSKGKIIKCGEKDCYKFTNSNGFLYWINLDSYGLAIYSEKSIDEKNSSETNLDISSFTF